eukprot:CAMPEP_0184985472 /NCGR_PEP_ID=MMETSP1098-20130426/14132_1 /TAXON_ID=89044 /ORGANISM="Spumella elongata, Strain CCAP 955/1" /LENGTH=404 /DNA_ID=CAMNT_0027509561 /DNA_START=32 /DNA_END=1246 /DNA_ORIENTATION=-
MARRVLCFTLKLLVAWVFFYLNAGANVNPIEIVSIIDHLSVPACLLKIHSIIESAEDKLSLSFKFLLMPSPELPLQNWTASFSTCFPDVKFESKVWERPPRLLNLSGDNFEKDVIFARFYLVDIFPTVEKFIYLDNDIIVTADLYHLFAQKLIRTDTIPGSAEEKPHTPSVESTRHLGKQYQHLQKAPKVVGPPATVGFVYETHPGYKDYLHAHFNLSHPFVRKAVDRAGPDAFLNGGVFVVDAVRWRQKKFTQMVEILLLENQVRYLYSNSAVGDQGPFLLLFQDETAYLHPKYNMRRLPKKTINMLNDGQTTGIVHFAGTTRGDAEHLCREPLKYPIFLNAAVPLYLSVAHSFATKLAKCPLRIQNSSCASAVPIVKAELSRQRLEVRYNPGVGGFSWPPPI